MLTRVKTFVATGLATAGRLYAGDLNSIQDAVAAQSDYAQRVDALTFGIGESGLALTRYGSGEARLTGLIRTDGMIRALGGFLTGQFTTTQRDAIALGFRPFGVIIYNTTTNRYEYNKGTDATPSWQPLSGINVQKGGAGTVSEGGINFIQGTGITITLADNPGTGYADVTITSTPAAIATIPIGGGCVWFGSSDPTNFLICDGRSLIRTTPYDLLFGQIGTQYGAVDGTHFNIPDCRGRTIHGVNSQVALAANEGVAVNNRSPYHEHFLSRDVGADDSVLGGVHLAPGHSPGGSYIPLSTSGSAANVDAPAFLGANYVIRYQ
jgi:hypothetical protein